MPAARDELDAWVLATWSPAVGYAASLLRDRSEAEDVVHDCYCNLLRKADTYDLTNDGRKLLFRAVTHACIKRNTRRRPALSLDSTGPDADWRPQPIADVGATEPVDAIITRELEAAIAAGLAQLPANQQAALQLKCLDHSLEDIAAALNVSLTNAGVLVHRARQALALHLTKYTKEQAE